MNAAGRALSRLSAYWVPSSMVALLAVVASSVAAPVAQGASPSSAFSFESELGDSIAGGNAGYLATPDASFIAVESPPYTLSVAEGGVGIWSIYVAGPGGTALVPGTTYNGASWPQDHAAPGLRAYWTTHRQPECEALDGDFTVHDVAYDGDRFTKLSMSFDQTCAGADGSLHGELRFNATTPGFKGLTRDPVTTDPTSLAVYIALGTTSAKKTFTLENVGTGSVTIGAASLVGAHPDEFDIVDDGCSSSPLAEGAACTLGVRLEPTAPGLREATLRIPANTTIGTREIRLEGTVQTPTTTTITGPTGWVSAPVDIRARVAPYPTVGPGFIPAVWFEFIDEPSLGGPAPLSMPDGSAAASGFLPPGKHRIYAEYNREGYTSPWGQSRSETIEVKVLQETFIELTSSKDPSLSSEPAVITAKLRAGYPVDEGYDFTAGEMVLKDMTTDEVLATLALEPGKRIIQVQPLLTAGAHLLRATFSGSEGVTASNSDLTQTVRLDAGATIFPDIFFPVVDEYRDNLFVEGWRASGAAVAFDIHAYPAGPLVHHDSLPLDVADFRWSWDGLDGAGTLVPPGEYDVTVTLDDGGPAPKIERGRVIVSHDWVTWQERQVMLAGDAYRLAGKSRDGSISDAGSRFSRGVQLASNKGSALVAYQFRVAPADAYGRITFEVRGRSPNRHKALVAVWNPDLGEHRLVGSYDGAKLVGSRLKWWASTVPGDGRPRYGKVLALVAVARNLGKTGPSTFDIERVRLTYQAGTIHHVASASAGDASLTSDLLFGGMRGDIGRSIADVAPEVRAARLRPRAALPRPPSVGGPVDAEAPVTRSPEEPSLSGDAAPTTPELTPEPTAEPIAVPDEGDGSSNADAGGRSEADEDERGTINTAAAKAKVRDVEPKIVEFGLFEAVVGEAVFLEVAIRDPGPDDTHKVRVDWGDGTSDRAAISEDGASASASHSYAEAGEYQLVVEVSDDDGSTASRSSLVAVFAPDAEAPAEVGSATD